MLRIFLAWWLRQLTALLPPDWRPAASGSAPDETADSVMLLLAPTRPGQSPSAFGTIDAARRRRKRLVALGRFALDPAGLASLRAAIGSGRHGPIRLAVPAPLLLEQAVTLPLAAERGLDDALRWEMDRLTPFTADAVFWTWRLVQRDRIRNQLSLRLVLVAKSAVQSALDALTAGDPARAISLTGPRRAAPRRPVLIGGLALCAGLVVAAIAIPFVRQQAELDRLDARIAELRPQVDIAETLRRRVADRTASADVVAAEAARVGNTLGMLATLTDLLPDDTSLYELALRDRVATFSGQSSQAARLIPALAADPAVRNPVFSAPVTRNDMTRTEAFAIRAEMQP